MTIETILVEVGEVFLVRLNATPTTGHLWLVQPLPDGLIYLGNDAEQLSEAIQAGDAMIQVFRFRAMHAGDFSIQFDLKRVWEHESVLTHRVTVKAT